jgi:hypothetical protein
VQRDVHQQLVERPVEERRVDRDHRVHPAGGQPGRRGQRVLLGDAHVEAALRERLGERRQPGRAEHRGGDRHHVRAAGPEATISSANTLVQPTRAARWAGRSPGRRRRGECICSASSFSGRQVAVALAGDRVHDHRPAEVPGPAQRRLHRRDVVPVDRPEVLEAEVGEQLLRAQRVLDPGLQRVQPGVDRPPTTGVRASACLPASSTRS